MRNALERKWPSNDFALVCAENKDSTNKCQKDGGYFCSSSGQLIIDRTKAKYDMPTCEDKCVCINLSWIYCQGYHVDVVAWLPPGTYAHLQPI